MSTTGGRAIRGARVSQALRDELEIAVLNTGVVRNSIVYQFKVR